jgi:hypothetical protein
MPLSRAAYRGTAFAELREPVGFKGVKGKVGYWRDYEFIATK